MRSTTNSAPSAWAKGGVRMSNGALNPTARTVVLALPVDNVASSRPVTGPAPSSVAVTANRVPRRSADDR